MLNFNFSNDRPIYVQLVGQLQLYIISGKIPPGEKLPPVRELATIAKVNPNTIQRALFELESQNLIHTERTNGKFVTTKTATIDKLKRQIIYEQIQNFLENMEKLGFTKRDIIKILKSLE